ncbi:MAG: MFS transporter [Anaerolineae bacterium]|nr:MFS transporter [Anaerolineae bacterium]
MPDHQTHRFPALRYRDFRLLWTGQMISSIGSQMQLIALNWHIYALMENKTYTLSLLGEPIKLSGEALGLGGLGLVRVIPVVIFALLGGIVADIYDRRRILIVTQSAAMIASALLMVLTFAGHDSVLAIYLIAAAAAAVFAFDAPAGQSLIPNLVAPEHLSNAVSLNTLLWYFGTVIGPAVAGVLVGQFGVGMVYAVDVITFGAVLAGLVMMRYRRDPAQVAPPFSWSALREGVHFTYRSRLIWSTMLLDFFATFFSSARTMLPIVADDILKVGVEGYGLLATAQPVGAVIAGVTLATSRREIYRQGVWLLVSVAVYGVATALFGVSTVFLLSYVLFALTGAGDTISTVIRGTIRQIMTPDRLRGRMTSVNMVFFMGGPQLGELEAGLVAAVFGVPFAIVTGGVATVLLTGWIAWRYTSLRRYTSDTAQAHQREVAAA